MSSDGEIKKSISASLILPGETDVLNDMVTIKVSIDGIEYKLGEYYIATATKTVDEYGAEYTEIEGYDGAFLPSRYRTEETYHITAGESYTNVIQSLLIESGVEKILAENSDETFQTDREDWEIGTSYLEIINTLLSEINYESLWFDSEGYARITPKKVVSVETLEHVYQSGEYSILKSGSTRETDIFDKYNIFIAYVDNPDNDSIMIAKAENNDATSILSIQKRGRIQSPIKRLDNISSQEELQAYVDNWRNESMVTTETLTIETGIDGSHNVLDTVQVEDQLYLETEWEITLSADATMMHTLKREMYI